MTEGDAPRDSVAVGDAVLLAEAPRESEGVGVPLSEPVRVVEGETLSELAVDEEAPGDAAGVAAEEAVGVVEGETLPEVVAEKEAPEDAAGVAAAEAVGVPLGVTVAVPESVGEGEPLPVLDAGAPGEAVGEGVLLSEPVAEAPAAVTVGEAVGVGVLLSEPVALAPAVSVGVGVAAGVGDCVAPPPPEHVVTMTSVEDPCVSASQPVVICMDGMGCAQSRALNGKAETPPVALHVTKMLGAGAPPDARRAGAKLRQASVG